MALKTGIVVDLFIILLIGCRSRKLPVAPGPVITDSLVAKPPITVKPVAVGSATVTPTTVKSYDIDYRRRTIMGDTANTQPQFSAHTLIVFYEDSVGKGQLLKAVKKWKCEIIYDYTNFKAVAIRLPDTLPIGDAVARFGEVKGVLRVNRDTIYHLE